MQPPFHICTYDGKHDTFVSGTYLKGQAWEAHTTRLILKHLQSYKDFNRTAVFVDCGVNIGSHALYVAANGFMTWGVDPLSTNLVKVYHAAR